MKTFYVSTIGLFLLMCSAARSLSQVVDHITVANGKKLHFQIAAGRRDDIILFESGGGDDVRVWNGVLEPVAQVTGATLITYDRPGFGASEVDPEHHGLMSDMERLESGLKELGYTGHYTLVAHSLGGFYTTLFASRHPEQVRAAVLMDTNLACFFTDKFLPKMLASDPDWRSYKSTNPGRYYLSLDYEPMVQKMRSVSFPKTIPLIDFVADLRTFPAPEDTDRWRSCHAAFAAEASNRIEMTAYGTGHYIFKSNPELAIAAILQAHALANGIQRPELEYAVSALNEQKRKDGQFARSEEGLNQWGYDLIPLGQKEQAIRVFELNTSLHPTSSNAFDSLGEGYEAIGDTTAAIRSYQEAAKLDPTAKHAAERLKFLSVSK
jgi:pimeloyl-ACP methyl ester carboxylesterase